MRTSDKVRNLSIEDMGITFPETAGGLSSDPTEQSSDDQVWKPELAGSDLVYLSVEDALADGYAGAILVGPPGTSKSWYAERIARVLAGSLGRVCVLQFHPSYQYEDFIQGWVSNGVGGFQLENKHFLQLCEQAKANPKHWHVLVIDEISRCDVSRVFGEALTYLETSLRGKPFRLASGSLAEVPRNLCIIATMNPWDLSVDELDFALQRRFAHIEMPPSTATLQVILVANGVNIELRQSIVAFFEMLQRKANPMLRIGHAYFSRVRDLESLFRLWAFQLKPHIAKATRQDAAELQSIESAWTHLIVNPHSKSASDVVQDNADAPAATTNQTN